MNPGLIFALVTALAAIIYGAILIKVLLAMPTGSDKMKEIALAIQQGASAYLNRQ